MRRRLHERPEIGNDLPITREVVLECLEGLPLDITLHETTSGVAALADGRQTRPDGAAPRRHGRAAARTRTPGSSSRRRSTGQMHACGHDTHTAMLLGHGQGAGGTSRRDPGPRAVHVPARRGGRARRAPHAGGGPARRAAARRRHARRPVTGAFALHITSTIPTGMVATKGGPAMAAADTFEIVVRGAGGHASEPFRTIDPIPIACEIVQALQLMVTRRVDIFDPAVVTVGQHHGRHHQQHHPGDGRHRRHDPHDQRATRVNGARRPEPRRREASLRHMARPPNPR